VEARGERRGGQREGGREGAGERSSLMGSGLKEREGEKTHPL